MKNTALFFDLDGTLFDTRADLAATVNHTRADLGLDAIAQDKVIANVGQGARYLMANSIPEWIEIIPTLFGFKSSATAACPAS